MIELNKYRHHLPVIKYWCDSRKKRPIDGISEIAIATNIPIIAICYFIGELYGFDDELNTKIKRLKEFYKEDVLE